MTTSRFSTADFEKMLERVDVLTFEALFNSRPGRWDPSIVEALNWFCGLPRELRKVTMVAVAIMILGGQSEDLPALRKTIDAAMARLN